MQNVQSLMRLWGSHGKIMKIAIFWDVARCCLVDRCWSVREISRLFVLSSCPVYRAYSGSRCLFAKLQDITCKKMVIFFPIQKYNFIMGLYFQYGILCVWCTANTPHKVWYISCLALFLWGNRKWNYYCLVKYCCTYLQPVQQLLVKWRKNYRSCSKFCYVLCKSANRPTILSFLQFVTR